MNAVKILKPGTFIQIFIDSHKKVCDYDFVTEFTLPNPDGTKDRYTIVLSLD